METEKKAYGLFTSVSLIVGIVIGSGIYFRADNILKYTQGNVLLGMVVLAVGAICIVFGSLTLSEYSKRTSASGGLVAYFEEFVSKKLASGYGWFQLFVYLPSIGVIVAWAAAIYTYIMLGIDATLLQQVLLGLGYYLFFLVINTFQRKLGGHLQDIATIIKIIPLVVIAIFGLFYSADVTQATMTNTTSGGFGWIVALVPIAYSYDGWTVMLNVTQEIKDSHKNVAKAMIFGPFIVLIVYLGFFYGMTRLLGSEQILALQDKSIFVATSLIFGEQVANVILVIVVISILGVLNGITLSFIRLPQALAEKGMLAKKGLEKIHPKYHISLKSSLLVGVLTLFWSLIHYLVMTYDLFNGLDVSEISIVFNYCLYIILYIKVMQMTGKKLSPLLAIVGSLIIFLGSLISNPAYVLLFMGLCSLVFLGGMFYSKRNA